MLALDVHQEGGEQIVLPAYVITANVMME